MTTRVGGEESRRSQISVSPSGGASGSTSATSLPVWITVEVTWGSQPESSAQPGWRRRQIHRPGAMSVGGMPPYTRRGAEIAHIWRSPKRRELMEELETAQVFENEGVEGCAHRRGGKRNVLFVAAEDLESVGVTPGRVKENFTVRGADVMSWRVGQRLQIGDAEFEISMVCDPCELMEEIRPGLQAELEGKRGMLAKVLRTGRVSRGDEVVLLPVTAPDV